MFDCLDVTWYGGEPLLNMSTIERLSNFFVKMCNENKIEYCASVVTNGYNITKEILDVLKKCEVTTLQITIDGDEETHNKRRPLRGGQGTFKRIMDNMTNLREELIPVSLRINVDKENCASFEAILKELQTRELTSKVTPYIAKVEKDESSNKNNLCLTMEEFLTHKDKFFDFMCKYGYTSLNMDNYPMRINSLCGCDRVNTYVIGPDGSLYKCWQSIGNRNESIGNVNDLKQENKSAFYYKCMMFDPSLDFECQACKYLPICMGGCSKRRAVDKKQVCEQTKYNFERKLNDIALEIIELKRKRSN